MHALVIKSKGLIVEMLMRYTFNRILPREKENKSVSLCKVLVKVRNSDSLLMDLSINKNFYQSTVRFPNI